MKGYLDIDVGSVSTNISILSEEGEVMCHRYLLTHGQPIAAVQRGLADIRSDLPGDFEIHGVGTTGSARQLTGLLVGADVVKNEITAHAMAAIHFFPDVKTVLEIGGQDSKIIIIRDGLVIDFGMNTGGGLGREDMVDTVRRAIQRASALAANDLKTGLSSLATIGPSGPFVGLLGTVVGFITAFQWISSQGSAGLAAVSAGISEALVVDCARAGRGDPGGLVLQLPDRQGRVLQRRNGQLVVGARRLVHQADRVVAAFDRS